MLGIALGRLVDQRDSALSRRCRVVCSRGGKLLLSTTAGALSGLSVFWPETDLILNQGTYSAGLRATVIVDSSGDLGVSNELTVQQQ